MLELQLPSPPTPYTEDDARSFFAHQEQVRRRGEELAGAEFARTRRGDVRDAADGTVGV
jgi:hypothetical protein